MNKQNVHNLLFAAAGILLLLTMISLRLVCGLYARYAVSDLYYGSARIAAGLPMPAVKEHKAVLITVEEGEDINEVYSDDMIYVLDENEEVDKNTYDRVMPGVDICKDPFIRLNGSSEVDYELYVKVIEDNFPVGIDGEGNTIKTVTYKMEDNWQKVTGEEGVYKYKTVFDANSAVSDEIYILKDNRLIVSQYYDGSSQSPNKFTLTFEVWLEQVD